MSSPSESEEVLDLSTIDWKSLTTKEEVNEYVNKLKKKTGCGEESEPLFVFYILLLRDFASWYCKSDSNKHYVRRARNHMLQIDATAPPYLQHGSAWLEKLGEWIQGRRQEYIKYKYKSPHSTTARKWQVRFDFMDNQFPLWYDPVTYRKTPMCELVAQHDSEEDIVVEEEDKTMYVEAIRYLFEKHITLSPLGHVFKLISFDLTAFFLTQKVVKDIMGWDGIKCVCLPKKNEIVPVDVNPEDNTVHIKVIDIGEFMCEYTGGEGSLDDVDAESEHNVASVIKVDNNKKIIYLGNVRERKTEHFRRRACRAHKYEEERQMLCDQIHFMPSEFSEVARNPKQMRKGRFQGLSEYFLPPTATKRSRGDREDHEDDEDDDQDDNQDTASQMASQSSSSSLAPPAPSSFASVAAVETDAMMT